MLIRLLEINCEDGKDEYADARYLASYKEKNYASFIGMLTALKDSDEIFHIAVDDEWYTVDAWVFNFPKNDEYLPCINVYVI